MKKIIIGLAVVVLFSSTTFGIDNRRINPQAVTTFEKEFKGATNVKWQEEKDVVKVDFFLNSSHAEAYFNSAGELLGTARNIIFTQLPLLVVNKINSRYGFAPVFDVTEYTSNGETFYHMTVEFQSKRLTVEASSSGELSVLKKTRL